MILIPAIDILGGKCVRLLRGEYDKVTTYGDNPVKVAETWVKEGAKRLHLVDLDGAKDGLPTNINMILKIARTIPIPVEVGGGIRTSETIHLYLTGGVERVILGTSALHDPVLLEESAARFPGRVWVGIDGKDEKVAVAGWLEETSVDVYDFGVQCEQRGAGGIIFTDIARDGTLVGPNLESLSRMAGKLRGPMIASGGISRLEDLVALKELNLPNLEGVIVGKALYSGAFGLKEGIKILE